MTEHISEQRMYELVDGAALSAGPGGELEHLDACPECRTRLEDLSDVVAGLRGLPTEATTPDGLWAGIASRRDDIAGRPGAVVQP